MGQYYKPISIDKKQFVYSHDYQNGLKLMEHSYIGNEFMRAVEGLIAEGGAWHGDRIVWAGDYADPEPRRKNNLYHIVSQKEASNKIQPAVSRTTYRYLVNMDKKQFVDMNKVPVTDTFTDEDGIKYHFRIHPLSLMTCEGNNRGGGDYRGESSLIGMWARDRVTVSNTKPIDYKEIKFNLVE